MTEQVRIGTRRSALALWQAEHVKGLLLAAHPALEITLVKMTTRGDQFLQASLAEIGGKGLFTREIEEALLRGEVDLAVHSLKDMPAEVAPGLTLAASPTRADPRDALCAKDGRALSALPKGARIGTSSLRREVQLRRMRPDLEVVPLRGNVPTRLSKIEGELDGVLLAAAGLERLGLAAKISQRFEVTEMLPAVGQGILGLERRSDDARMAALLAPLGDAATDACGRAERALLTSLGASCSVPLGGHATIEGSGDARRLRLVGLLMDPVTSAEQRVEGERALEEAEALGRKLGAALLAGPAAAVLSRGK